MEIDFSKIFHQSSKDRYKGHPPIPNDSNEWPDEWKTTYFKTYPRLPKIDLKVGPPAPADFFHLVSKRESRRDFTRKPLTKAELSSLLQYSCGQTGTLENERKRRAQPSGGANFPIEIYPIVFRSGVDLKAGLYHYNVREHALDVLWDREFTDADIGGLFTYPWVKDASLAIVMTAVFWRNQQKYGERGYRFILLEAGHIGQNTTTSTTYWA